MTLMPVYFTTTNTRRRKTSKKTAKIIAAQKELDKHLKKMGYTSSNNKQPTPSPSNSYGMYSSPIDRYTPKTSDIIPSGVAVKPKAMVYSGENKLIGVAVMHKSNLVPIFADNKEKAKEIASMRR